MDRKHVKFPSFSTILVIVGLVLLAVSFGPLIKDELWFYLNELRGQKFLLKSDLNGSSNNSNESVFGKILGINRDSPFASFLSTQTILITPVNKDFSVVIEKIGVNAPIVADVPVTDENAYREALKSGVAHAASSNYPSDSPGNVYLFAHTSLNFWDLGKYATVFNLLRKLEIGDKAHIFFRGRDFEYSVVNKEILPGWNTYPLVRPVIEPILTLQTCDPPGTTLNRLVITAKLVASSPAN